MLKLAYKELYLHNLIITLFLLLKINFSYSQKIILESVDYYQGLVKDQLVLKFNDLPICICEPKVSKNTSSLITPNNCDNNLQDNLNYQDKKQDNLTNKLPDNLSSNLPNKSQDPQINLQINSQASSKDLTQAQNKRELIFIFPFAYATENSKQVIKNLINKDYHLKLEQTSKGVKSLKIFLDYDLKKIGCAYGHARNGENSYTINLYHKPNIRNTDKLNNKLRWYSSNEKKKLRVTIDITNKNRNIQSCSKEIANILRSKDIEVNFINKFNNYKNKANYTNCLTKPDLFLSLELNPNSKISKKPIDILIASNSIFLTKPKDLSKTDLYKIRKISNHIEDKNLLCCQYMANNLDSLDKNILIYKPKKCLTSQIPFGIETAALSIIFNKDSLNSHMQVKTFAKACADAIYKTISHKNNRNRQS